MNVVRFKEFSFDFLERAESGSVSHQLFIFIEEEEVCGKILVLNFCKLN